MVKIMVWVVKIGQLVLMKIAFYAKKAKNCHFEYDVISFDMKIFQ